MNLCVFLMKKWVLRDSFHLKGLSDTHNFKRNVVYVLIKVYI